MATPNSEQLLAIEHNGGVLLKAGAGSGKTFVLKEHMVYLVKSWISQYKNEQPIEDFSSYIKGKLRKIVLMTFTNKAAGELEIRLINEFSAVLEESKEDKDFWRSVLENISYLNVSTIHGFCLKLIKQGLIKGVSAEENILTENEFKGQIQNIFEKWILNTKFREHDLFEVILKEQDSLHDSICKIFSDPSLRVEWEKINNFTFDQSGVDDTCKELLDLYGFSDVFKQKPDLNLYQEYSDKKWFVFLTSVMNELNGIQADFSGIIKLNEFLANLDYKIPVKPSAKNSPESLIEYYESFKSIKDFLKKNGEHFSNFLECYDENVAPWFMIIKDLFDYTQVEYRKRVGLTFADLEYYVYKGLEDKETVELVGEQFNYFIVDEFQDTSFIQFSILRKIIKDNFIKLFCVGDLKQAIYGFRGGELGVFLECQKLIPQNLTLNNNYRSSPNIINFNNIFFDYVFGLGHNFKGIDQNKVKVDYQNDPGVEENPGRIQKLKVDLSFFDSSEKISNAQIDYYEALALLDQIKLNLKGGQKSAVLYKRLKPSLLLIDVLIKNNIGFTAQLKIPFIEDPILGIFYVLIGQIFDINDNKSKYLSLKISSYMKILNLDYELREKDIEKFHLEGKLVGYYQSYLNLLKGVGISTANYGQNLSTIRELINTSGLDIAAVFSSLQSLSSTSYNNEFQFGNDCEKVVLMTAHASKGLEFEHVLVGGIYTNENMAMSQATIGKFPFSFKWKKSIYGKKRFKTPHLILEEEISKRKDFNESKRLFYVANTRAENELSFVDFQFETIKRSKSQSGHWFKAIELFLTKNQEYPIEERWVELNQLRNSEYERTIQNRPSLIYTDELGLKVSIQNDNGLFLPELSVTRLASFFNCPRKFYLSNICKLNEEDMEIFGSSKNSFDYTEEIEAEDLNSKNVKMSGSSRGSYFHEQISQKIIQNDFSEMEVNEFNIQNSINWTVDKLKNYVEDFELVSEKPMKFEVFGYMISGIPDLICLSASNEKITEIWDFKTGLSGNSNMDSYFFQLISYAYALFVTGSVAKEKPIKLVLCFSDEQKLLDKTISFLDVENYLFEFFSNLNNFGQINEDHCPKCSFSSLCTKSS